MPRKKSAAQLDREIAEVIYSPHPLTSTRTVERQKLADLRSRFPVGAGVKVKRDIRSEFLGASGEVVGYDLGSDDDEALIKVRYDAPVQVGSIRAHSGKYHDDEITLISRVANASKKKGRR